jgi:hypothetical protein
MRVQLKVGGEKVQCNQVICCKMINEDEYVKKRTKAVNGSSDVFLVVTPAQATDFIYSSSKMWNCFSKRI